MLPLKDNSPLNLWWAPKVQNFHALPLSSFPASPAIKLGTAYISLTFNPEKHIRYLLNRVLACGGRTVQATLPTENGISGALEEASRLASPTDKEERKEDIIFINATGIGAHTFVPDPNVQPIRGQTLLISGEASRISTHLLFSDGDDPSSDEKIAYIVPRKGTGTTVIGGTKEVGNWKTEPDEGVSKEILERAKVLAPELVDKGSGEMEVLKVQVGLRPGRKGGVRVESEVLGGGVRVVHAYGHAGAGFQNSVGCARKVVRLVRMLVK